MCGIVAILSQARPVQGTALQRAMRALLHRGPDGNGLWVSSDRLVGLGHSRLSIIDLETGAQPISNEDGQIHIIVNGEFYDFERIRRDLEGRGHRFRTRSDSEIALHLYEDYGVDCLSYLRGEFAFILWDQKNHLLFAARDRFGIKPLCYSLADDTLYIASEAKALFAAGITASWDSDAFYHAASLQYVPQDRTLFGQIYQLPPGYYLLARNSGIEIYRYWDLDYPPAERALTEREEKQLIPEFKERLEEAVRLRLRADVPLCCYLSGGLDSSSLLGLAIQQSASPIECFTVSFEEEPYDEFKIAREMAAHAGASLNRVGISQSDLIDNLSDAVYYSEGLAINGHLSAKFILSRVIRQAGFKVVLTGEGSDEIVAGYPHLRKDLFLAEGFNVKELLAELHASNTISAGIQLSHGESLTLDAVRETLGFIPSFLEAKGTFGYRVHSVLSDDFKAQFAGHDCFRLLLKNIDVQGQLKDRHPVNQSTYIWSKLALANYILRTLGDGAEMAHSVEGRLPFLDHHLFEFARQLPMSLKIKGRVEKYILREAIRPLITETIYRREKQPFTAPPISCFSTPGMNEFMQDMLRSKVFASIPFYSQSRVLHLLEQLPEMDLLDRAAMDPVLMMILTTCILHQRFNL